MQTLFHLHQRPARPARAAQRGVAVIEFALTLTLLTTLFFGVCEYGRAMYQYNTVVKSGRAATRYLTQYAAGDATAIANAKCLAVYGQIAPCSGTPLVPGLTTLKVTVCDASIDACKATHAQQATAFGLINLVTVTISGLQFQPLVSAVPAFTFGSIHATMSQRI